MEHGASNMEAKSRQTTDLAGCHPVQKSTHLGTDTPLPGPPSCLKGTNVPLTSRFSFTHPSAHPPVRHTRPIALWCSLRIRMASLGRCREDSRRESHALQSLWTLLHVMKLFDKSISSVSKHRSDPASSTHGCNQCNIEFKPLSPRQQSLRCQILSARRLICFLGVRASYLGDASTSASAHSPDAAERLAENIG